MAWSTDGVALSGACVISSGRSVVRDVKIRFQRFAAHLHKTSVTVDAEGLLLSPGLVDIQINGFGGKEFVQGDEGIALAQTQLPQYGVTSFLPTIGSMPLERYRPSGLRGVVERARARSGAEVLGWHLEGPFINPHLCGIHRTTNILDHLDEPFWKELFRTGSIALMTLAPEMPFSDRLLDILAESNVAAAIGHSEAADADLLMAYQKGVRFVSHLFNAMVPFHHRCPGIIGAVLGDKRFGFTLISDLHHLFPEALQIAFRSNQEGLAITTDGAPLMGSTEKSGVFLGNAVEVYGEKVLTIPQGGLAGSMIPLDEQLRRFMAATGCSFQFAVRASSETPSSFVNVGHRKGKIAAGYDADCVLWEMQPQGPSIVATFCKGEVAYSRADFWSRVVCHG